MPCIRFVRATHRDGRFRSFPDDARQFWREQGELVGEALRHEAPLTFREIVAACRERALEEPDGMPSPLMDEAYIAWCLVRLLELGMVTAVAAPGLGELDGD